MDVKKMKQALLSACHHSTVVEFGNSQFAIKFVITALCTYSAVLTRDLMFTFVLTMCHLVNDFYSASA